MKDLRISASVYVPVVIACVLFAIIYGSYNLGMKRGEAVTRRELVPEMNEMHDRLTEIEDSLNEANSTHMTSFRSYSY